MTAATILIRESAKSETHWVPQDEEGFHDFLGESCACHPDHTAENVWVHRCLDPTIFRGPIRGFPGMLMNGPARDC